MQCRHTHQLISATWQSNKYRNFPHQTWNTNFFLGLYVTVNYKIASGCKAKNRHIIHWFKNSPPKLNIKLTVCEKWKVAPLVNLCIHLLILIFDLFYLENWADLLLLISKLCAFLSFQIPMKTIQALCVSSLSSPWQPSQPTRIPLPLLTAKILWLSMGTWVGKQTFTRMSAKLSRTRKWWQNRAE